jgi:putative deaminase of polymorphic toxin system
MGARDYAPGTGTFTQLDSVAGGAVNPLTMNRFLYALANPATLIDPDGHKARGSPGGGGGGTSPEEQSYCDLHPTKCDNIAEAGGGGGGGNPEDGHEGEPDEPQRPDAPEIPDSETLQEAWLWCAGGAGGHLSSHLMCMESYLGSAEAAWMALALYDNGTYEPSEWDGVVTAIEIGLTIVTIAKGRIPVAAPSLVTLTELQLFKTASQFRYLATVGRTANVAALNAEIAGMDRISTVAASGSAARPGGVGMASSPVFTPTIASGTAGGPAYLRNADAEYKLLEDLASRLGGPSASLTGRVTIFSERMACDSCMSVIQQFQERFPQIEVVIINGYP